MVDGYHELKLILTFLFLSMLLIINILKPEILADGSQLQCQFIRKLSRKGRNGDYIWEHEK